MNWEQLQARLKQLAAEHGIVHFAVGASLDPSFMDGLLTLVADNSLPGFPIQWDEWNKFFVPVVVSTTVEKLSDLDPELQYPEFREMFNLVYPTDPGYD